MRLRLTWAAVCLAGAFSAGALASEQLALEQGCFSCHGPSAQKNAPSFEQLARQYAPYQGQTKTLQDLANDLRRPALFGGIKAHERVSTENALTLIQWLADGAP